MNFTLHPQSNYDLEEIYNFLGHRSAYMVFEINDFTRYGITLPSKYYKGLFPEIGDKYAEWQQKKLKHSDSKDIGKSWEAWAKAS